jgi:hypothetical protein
MTWKLGLCVRDWTRVKVFFLLPSNFPAHGPVVSWTISAMSVGFARAKSAAVGHLAETQAINTDGV